MKKSTLIIAGVTSFLLTSATQLPASLVARLLPANLPVTLDGIGGTLWQGQIAQVQWQNWQLQNVRWQLKPAALFKGQAAAMLQAELAQGGQIDTDCGLSISGKVICAPFNLDNFPAQTLNPYVQRWMVPPLKGTFQARLTSLTAQSGHLPQLVGHLTWQNAGISLNPQSFGNYTAILSMGDNEQQNAQISAAPEANFQLDGNLSLQTDGQYKTNLTLKPVNSDPMTTAFLSGALGSPQPDGSYLINRSGKMPR